MTGQDTRDGMALRRLREALGRFAVMELYQWDADEVEAASAQIRVKVRRYVYRSGNGATIAEAADKCREALP